MAEKVFSEGIQFGGKLETLYIIWEFNLAVAGYFWPKSLLKAKKPNLRPEIQLIGECVK